MIFLSALIFLKPLHVGLIGLIIIIGHNALDGIHANNLGHGKLFWMIFHEQGFVSFGNGSRGLGVLYPLVPWMGVMAAGYGFGLFFTM